MVEFRLAKERGVADFGWLHSKHSFSFGSYYDPKHMGHSALRVINDDTVIGGKGFDTHGHRDMEIISYVSQGSMEHKDSMGNIQRLPEGEFQLMSAGAGITHSEYNASQSDLLKFLQIWIVPDVKGGKPRYQQKNFGKTPGLTPIITPNGENGTLQIKQHARLSQLILQPGESYELRFEEAGYIHQIEGQLALRSGVLNSGDGAKIRQGDILFVNNIGTVDVIALVFDLPAQI